MERYGNAYVRPRCGEIPLGLRMARSVLLLLAMSGLHAHANQLPTKNTGGANTDTTVTKTYPSGLTYTLTLAPADAGAVSFTGQSELDDTGDPVSSYYAPAISVSASNAATHLRARGNDCTIPGDENACLDRGTVTLSFSRPVANPVLHLSGLGATGNESGDIMAMRLRLTSPAAGVTLSGVGAATNLSVTADAITTATLNGRNACAAANAGAGCGSVRVNGTVSQLVFAVDLRTEPDVSMLWTSDFDTIGLTVSVDEDFGDAPAGYAGVAPSHVLGDLRLGSVIDADNLETTASTTSPHAVASGADNTGTRGDGIDEDAMTGFPALATSSTRYDLTVPISGASAAGMVCGWIDFNGDGVFVVGERACTPFTAGSGSVALAWSTAAGNAPSGATAGNRYVRLRAGYGVAQIQTADGSGRADSGEVEEYWLTITPSPTITVTKVSHGGVGAFTFTGSNGFPASPGQTLTTSTPGAGVDGAIVTLTATDTATTLTEATTPGYVLTGISCTGLGAGGTATPTIPGSGNAGSVLLDAAATAPGSNIRCTFTNARVPILRLQKSLPHGRVVAGNQFTLAIAGSGAPASVTTTGTGTTATGTVTHATATLGSVYTLSETAAGSPGTVLSAYRTTYSCSNALAGGQEPSGSTTSFTITPVAGDDLTCTFFNRWPQTEVSVQKTVDSATVASGQSAVFTLAVSNTGAEAANGARIHDPAVAGLDCIALSCAATAGASCPDPSTVAGLQTAPGLTIPALAGGSSVTFQLTCAVTATGVPP